MTETDLYRRALIRLACLATSGERKTLDKSEVAEIAGGAVDRGNEIHRRAKELRAKKVATTTNG